MRTLAGAGFLALVTTAVLLTAVGSAHAATHRATLALQTVPRTPGVRVSFDGRTYLTGPDGSVAIISYPGSHHIGILPPASQPTGTSLRFGRWLDHLVLPQRTVRLRQGVNREDVGFVVSHPVSLRVTNPSGQTLPLSKISSITLTSSLGLRFTFAARRPLAELAANHIVRKPSGLVSLPVRYAVQALIMDGANVVHEGGQSFYVQPRATWTVKALVFPLRVEVRDALFRFAIGHAVKLTFPGGLTRIVDLGAGHAATVIGLPRGQYELVPKGPGIGLTSPTALSRPQGAKLLLFSWLDVAAVLAFAALFLIGLPVAGGRIVRRPRTHLPSWRAGLAEVLSLGDAVAPPPAPSTAVLSSEPRSRGERAWDVSPWERARQRRRGLLITLAVAIAVALGVATVTVSVVSAASNYAAGKQALAAGRYREAADRLASAKILAIVPYANADSLYKQARELSNRAAATVQQLQAKADQAAGLYAKANVALSDHRYGDAVRLYRRVLALSPAYADTQTRLTKAKNLAARRVRLQSVFDQALTQANAGHWQLARRLAKKVLSEDPRFPGARKLSRRIAAAIAVQQAAQTAAPAAPTPAYTPPASAYTPPAPQATPPPP
jgi:hypothetical protein